VSDPTAMVLVAAVAILTAALTTLVIVAAGWRRERRINQTVRGAMVDLATAPDPEAVGDAARRAVRTLLPARAPPRTAIARAGPPTAEPPGDGLIRIDAGDGAAHGALLVDPATASRRHLRPALESISAYAALVLERQRLTGDLASRTERAVAERFAHINDVVLIVDEKHRVRYASQSARALFGVPDLDGMRLPDLVDDDQRRSAEFLLGHAQAGDEGSAGDVARADWTIRAGDNRVVQVEVSCRPVVAGDPVSGVAVTLRDVTTQRHLERELTNRAFYDQLTGLPNRHLFSERVRQAIANRTEPVGLLLIDIDNFRAVNVSFGYGAGDHVLKEVAGRLRDAVGPDGVAARIGDDEFAAVVPDGIGQTPAVVAARVAEILAHPVPLDGERVACSASVGVAVSTGGESPQDVLEQAGRALAMAKAAGHGQWRRYDPSEAGVVADRHTLRTALSRAPYDDSLALRYQPIVTLDTGRTVGLEALLRWRHPTRGRLRPHEFMDIAEESGLIVAIGEWVLATATQAAEHWRAPAGDVAPYVSVNVSPQQLRSAGFVASVQRLLGATGLPPSRLVVEVTESLFLHDEDAGWDGLERLRGEGVRVAIDDFGTGYSALGYLRHAPLDLVKLDRLFISPLAYSTRQRELVTGIVRLARSLGLQVVAEGIESQEQLDLAASAGCAYGQGHLFARPVADPAAYLSETGGDTGFRARPR
jgi:diguanylate cyclase (GGDEF)-like protein/PAS domain S-box-containing protein